MLPDIQHWTGWIRTGLTVGAIMLAACASTPVDPAAPPASGEAALASEITLRVGQTMRIAATDLQLSFDRVVEDSRCPTGTECVWEGDAIVRVGLSTATKPNVTHDLHTHDAGKRLVDFEGFRIRLIRLVPAPQANARPAAADYVATVTVERT